MKFGGATPSAHTCICPVEILLLPGTTTTVVALPWYLEYLYTTTPGTTISTTLH
jgi:hypothetical protein